MRELVNRNFNLKNLLLNCMCAGLFVFCAANMVSAETYDPAYEFEIDCDSDGLGLTWKPIKNLELSLWGQNLLDDKHPEYAHDQFLTVGAGEIQRSFYGKITWRFQTGISRP